MFTIPTYLTIDPKTPYVSCTYTYTYKIRKRFLYSIIISTWQYTTYELVANGQTDTYNDALSSPLHSWAPTVIAIPRHNKTGSKFSD